MNPVRDFTIQDYVDNIRDTFQYWLDIHTNPEKWAENWAMDEVQYVFKESPILENNCFTFDWKQAAIKAYAENNKHLFNVCSNCGSIFDIGWDDEECCDNPNRDDEPTTEQLTQWLDDIGTDGLVFSDDDLMDALINDGFPVYADGMSGIIDSVVDEVKEVLQAIESANSNDKLLPIITWANHVCHVNGDIMKDYSQNSNIDYQVINAISQDGVNSIFSDDEIQEFIND